MADLNGVGAGAGAGGGARAGFCRQAPVACMNRKFDNKPISNDLVINWYRLNERTFLMFL